MLESGNKIAARNQRESRLALFSSWAVILFQFTLFLIIGVLLFVQYADHHLPPPKVKDSLYPAFIWANLPPGVAGLVIAAILAAGMSNLSAALNALASTTVMDFYKPISARRTLEHTEEEHTEEHFLKVARWATVAWGVVLFAIGLVARNWGSVLEAGLTIASILYGSLLGVFLLGLLTKRVKEEPAMVAMVVGLLAMISIKAFTHIAFTWYVLIGTSITFATGYLASFAQRKEHV